MAEEYGTHCHLSSCLRTSFLPLSCAFCRSTFCEAHFLPDQHKCSSPGASESQRILTPNELAKRVLRANPGRAGQAGSGQRLPCQKTGCKGFSLEVAPSGGTPSGSSSATPSVAVKDADGVQVQSQASNAFQHKAPTCPNCRGLFCVSHRAPKSHSCSAPAPRTEGQQRLDAAEERKRKAREILAKNFPGRK